MSMISDGTTFDKVSSYMEVGGGLYLFMQTLYVYGLFCLTLACKVFVRESHQNGYYQFKDEYSAELS